MKFSVLLTTLGFSFVSLAPIAQAFNNAYPCSAAAETTVGYAPASSRVEAEAGKVKKPYTVRLSGVASDTTFLHAQEVVPLAKLGDTHNVMWFAERASAGTIIVWTLFEKDDVRPVTLISTKSYAFSGAVSFTAFYTCN
jgi:hypothetical protein